MRSIALLITLVVVGCADSYRITVTTLQISNDNDNYGTPEIEVYLFDSDNDMIGCAGSRHGTQNVDVAGMRYELNAKLVDEDGDQDIRVGSGAIRFEVWEDDDDPVCPKIPNRMYNDILGVGPAMTLDEWVTSEELQFDAVTAFRVQFD